MAGLVQTIRCKKCGFSISLRAPGQTVTLACESCGALIDATDPEFSILSEFEKKITIKPAIPLGSRGEIQKIIWEVIGFMQRSAPENAYPWREYLLFNPMQGFRWLVEYNGHWSFVTTIREKPEKAGSQFYRLETTKYRLFNKGLGIVRFVIGEFYWRVKIGEAVVVEDYVAPPFVLSLERNDQEKIWSRGEYIEARQVQKIFGLSTIPSQSGIGANQPNKYKERWDFVKKTFLYFLGFLLVMQAIFWLSSLDKKVLDESYTYLASNSKNTWITPSFVLEKKKANLAVTLDTKLDNSWLSTELLLVNEDTQESFLGYMEVSYYHGYEDGESWSEGKRKESDFFSSIPGGNYHLVIVAEAGFPEPLPILFDKSSYSAPFRIILHRDRLGFFNLFFSIALLLPVPVFYRFFYTAFEKKRWFESDYSPYESEDDDS